MKLKASIAKSAAESMAISPVKRAHSPVSTLQKSMQKKRIISDSEESESSKENVSTATQSGVSKEIIAINDAENPVEKFKIDEEAVRLKSTGRYTVKIMDTDKDTNMTVSEEAKDDKILIDTDSAPKLIIKENPFGKKDMKKSSAKGVSYEDLCLTFQKIEATTKRLIISEYLVEFMVKIIKESPESLLHVVYLCLNKLSPEYEGLELGIGETLLIKAVAATCGTSTKAIKAEMAKVGDLGDVAQGSRGKQKTLFTPKSLTVAHVFKTLKDIALISGASSQQKKIDKINTLMVACKGLESKFLVRSLEGKLRIGLAEQTVLTALAHASVLSLSSKSREALGGELAAAESTLKSVYNELPTYDLVIPALLEHGIKNLSKHCKLTPGTMTSNSFKRKGVPLKPMLAHPTKSLTEVLDRFEGVEFTCEYKYDGERAQIHRLESGKTMIFSRNSENLSEKYPDILARISDATKPGVNSYVLDCESVAWDVNQKCILPFQILSTRKRKDVAEKDIAVQVCVFAFDLLYLNGQPVTGKTLAERRQLLSDSFEAIEGEFQFAKYLNTNNIDEIQVFLEDSVAGNCEGLMVKTLQKDSTYEPSKRSRNWLKVKKDYLSGIGDTVDLVVIGAYLGRGKRTGVYGGYLLACYDDENDEYQSICKIGTGFSDADLATQIASLKEHIIEQPKPYYKYNDNPNLRPDVWFDAAQVWEVKCADLSISPVHQAAMGLVDPNKGISLRFPRFIKIRDDKGPESATNASQIADLYNQQQINGKSAQSKEEHGDDE